MQGAEDGYENEMNGTKREEEGVAVFNIFY